jgi:3-oxoacyl-[acyl-carrier-protein] synthase II
MTRVAITGYAFASPYGDDEGAFWQGICHGPVPITAWSAGPAFPDVGCQAALLPAGISPADGPLSERIRALTEDLCRRTLSRAGFAAAPPGLGLAMGTLWGEHDLIGLDPARPPAPLLGRLAAALGLEGPLLTMSIACAAGNAAIAWACDRLRLGEARMMLAGGLDLVGPIAVDAYSYLGTMTASLPRPFGADRDGFLLGEGGGFFLLEPWEQAMAAGRPILAEVCGVGGGHDGDHPTRPALDGRGAVGAMRRAIADAGLTAAQIGYVNAHGPGTVANDIGETAAICTVFGPEGVPVNSTKAALGHAQGGANALEAVACLLALRHQTLPPTLHVTGRDPALAPIDCIVGAPRPHRFSHALSLAASMGGATWGLVFARGPAWA